ncbi:MAG: hypothetical protein ACXVGH_09160 [Mycobacteriales bacterium]
MPDVDRHEVVLEWVGDLASAPSGAELLLQVSLRNTGTLDVHVMHSSPWVRLLDTDGQQVDAGGWITAAGHAVTLRPAEARALTCSIELRGPRGGARRAPLPAGDYVLECTVLASARESAGGPQWTLTTPRRAITVVARELPRGG